MAKNAYLVVSDLHCYYKSFSSHNNYRDEMDFVQTRLIKVARKYKRAGYSVVLLLLGDVFHSSYKDVSKAVRDYSFFVLWKEAIGSIYSVIGNHELTYYDHNPFYSLITEMGSEKILNSSAKVYAPIGTMSVLNVVDRLDDGEVHFHFNHYGTEATRVQGQEGAHVGLFHQEILTQEILDFSQDSLGQNIYVSRVCKEVPSLLDGYKYSFFGHMHQVYGTWETENGSFLCYLASLGRTNVTEVSDIFLERNVPAVLVEDGKLCAVEDNKFDLMPRESCVNEVYVQAAKRTNDLIKAKKQVRSYLSGRDNPVDNLRAVLADYPQCLGILQGLLSSDIDDAGFAIRSKVRKEVYNDKL